MLEHMRLLKNIESAQRSMIVAKTIIETEQSQLSTAENIAEENFDKLEEFVHWHIVPGNDENQQAIADLFTEIRNRNATVLNGCITFKNDNNIEVEVEVIQQSTGRVLVIVDINRPCGMLVIGKDNNPIPRLENLLKRRDFRSRPGDQRAEAVNPAAPQTQTQQQTPAQNKQHKQPLCTEFVQAGIECEYCIYHAFGKCELTMLERGELQ